ncbi:hypothetical protein CNMCM5793_007773 [Aspergillus hiratsukae]|uniref:Uncharacterized protein n=1 Tax=Aspergillus hiratsukae TaxID=1194566 RepID=A0A8H6P1Q3_9EURO|nr:hypothetical protein CNMCM5793_007773 [Aspergillus hiratsukae]KAF7157782.1 hypothetical protein CNMCM6106_003911 [Aspergillus hiratsukae]
MVLTEAQVRTLTTVERVASTLSIFGVITILITFAFSRHFRNPMHRLIFINAFYNLFDFIATMIATSGPAAGNSSALCQFQGFCLQMFPMADVLWTLAMACDVFLVVYYQFDARALRKLEILYIAIITFIVSIPAIVFLFMDTPEKGSMYGSVTFNLSRTDHFVLSSNIPNNNHTFDQRKNTFAVTVQIDIQLRPTHDLHPPPTEQTPHASRDNASCANVPLEQKRPKHSNVSFRQYILMPMVFFLVLLATWVAPTINRISALVNPIHVSCPLLLAVGGSEQWDRCEGFGKGWCLSRLEWRAGRGR